MPNTVDYDITVPEGITPDYPLPELPPIQRGDLIVIKGHAPNWRLCAAFNRVLKSDDVGAIAIYNIRQGHGIAVVVVSRIPDYEVNQII